MTDPRLAGQWTSGNFDTDISHLQYTCTDNSHLQYTCTDISHLEYTCTDISHLQYTCTDISHLQYTCTDISNLQYQVQISQIYSTKYRYLKSYRWNSPAIHSCLSYSFAKIEIAFNWKTIQECYQPRNSAIYFWKIFSITFQFQKNFWIDVDNFLFEFNSLRR